MFVELAALDERATEATREAVRQALACIDAFTERFNARDTEGMDAHLHFPHVILAGERLVVWDGPGRHGKTFFRELAGTGWYRTRYRRREVVLATPSKVHLLVEYSRDDDAGVPLSVHRNLWIVTLDGGRWGLEQRSH
jgi:hypothetical protein